MIAYDVATKVLDTKIFHPHTITDLISDITFIVLFSQKKPLPWKNIDTHRHTQTHTRFQQIIEDSTCLFSENRHFDQNLSRQYALDWKENRECSDVLRYSDPPISEAWTCNKSKKFSDDPFTGDGVPGYGNNFKEMTITLPQEKL